jgi:hypothetical protein
MRRSLHYSACVGLALVLALVLAVALQTLGVGPWWGIPIIVVCLSVVQLVFWVR